MDERESAAALVAAATAYGATDDHDIAVYDRGGPNAIDLIRRLRREPPAITWDEDGCVTIRGYTIPASYVRLIVLDVVARAL